MNLSIKGTGSKTLSTPTAYCSLLELMLKLCQNNQDQSVLVCPLNLISLSLKLSSPPPSLALSPLSISLSLQFVLIMSVYSGCLGFSAVKLTSRIVTVTGFLTWPMMRSQY